MEDFIYINEDTYVSEKYLLKMMNSELRSGLIGGLILGLFLGLLSRVFV